MQQYLQNKKGLVKSVFDQVFDKYDLMEKKSYYHDESITKSKID